MVVNFRGRRISRGACKLTRTPTLIKKKIIIIIIILKLNSGVDPRQTQVTRQGSGHGLG